MIGAVLAGGKSRRFGRNKAFAVFQGERLIDRQIRILQSLFQEVLVVTNAPELYLDLDVTVVQDVVSGQGPLGGIYTSLLFAQGESVFATACDMPLLQPPLIRRMVELSLGHDVVIPQLGDYLEPLHAIYSYRCLPHIKRLLDEHAFQVIGFLPAVKVYRLIEEEIRRLDPTGLSFFNVNTKDDISRANELLAESNLRAGRIGEEAENQ